MPLRSLLERPTRLAQAGHRHRPRIHLLVKHTPGIFHSCAACGKRLCWIGVGTMISFPIEHGIYKFVPGFKIIGHIFGM